MGIEIKQYSTAISENVSEKFSRADLQILRPFAWAWTGVNNRYADAFYVDA